MTERQTTRRMSARNTLAGLLLIAGLVAGPPLALSGCGGNDFLGMEDYQRDLLFNFGTLAIALLSNGQLGGGPGADGGEPPAGEPLPGPEGRSCWDTSGDGVADPDEDVNGDGSFDARDCVGAEGANGMACWDSNGNGLADRGEDVNGDGFFDALDCRGLDGASGTAGVAGPPGEEGTSCWDVDGDGRHGAAEDMNGDGRFDALDCRGVNGQSGSGGANGINGQNGANGAAGANGLQCWDGNGNGSADPAEDLNADGMFTALDCRGADGANGVNGADGQDGTDGVNGADGQDGTDGVNGADGQIGTDGRDGVDGIRCWDTNGDGIGQPDEDANDDGFFTALDCRGADGTDGQNGGDGVHGLHCWDLNANGLPDADEDVNHDEVVSVLDCRGADGADGRDGTDGADGRDGVDGQDGTNGQNGADGRDGAPGISCWDLNADGIGQPEEDVNLDGFFTSLDCRGADGVDGADGTDGTDGTDGQDGTNGLNGGDGRDGADGTDGVDGEDGLDGLHCWDLNANGVADPDEDVNDDGHVTVLDCQGARGEGGLSCWDLNGNGVGEPNEDVNDDGFFNALDCRGAGGDGGGAVLFDVFIDDFFTIGQGAYRSIPTGDGPRPDPIEEPALGPTNVVAYRVLVPHTYSRAATAGRGNLVTMRMVFWREGPVEDCFVVRLDAFRARHGMGIHAYGDPRFIKLDDPPAPDPAGTLIVVDLPLNNADNDTAHGLCLPADLLAGDFLAFEWNLLGEPRVDQRVSYTIAGVEFFETPPGQVVVQHAKVFRTIGEVDCPVVEECRRDQDCDDGEFCNGEETCDEDGQCLPGDPPCEKGQVCDEEDDECRGCGDPVAEGKTVLCHVPPGGGDHAHTIVVGDPAVASHLEHGDSLGPCPSDCDDDTDDPDVEAVSAPSDASPAPGDRDGLDEPQAGTAEIVPTTSSQRSNPVENPAARTLIEPPPRPVGLFWRVVVGIRSFELADVAEYLGSPVSQ